MLSDMDATLKSLVRAMIAAPTEVRLARGRGRSSDDDGRSVVLTLSDVREDPTARTAFWQDMHDDQGKVVGRVPPSRRYRFHYLVTAEASDVDTEHEMLGELLFGLVAQDRVPAEHLAGTLAQNRQPVIVDLAPPDCGCHETSIHHEPPFGLHVVLIASCPVAATTELTRAPDTVRLGVLRGGEQPAVARSAPQPRGMIVER